LHRPIEVQAPFVDEPHRGGGGERFGDRPDLK
jgi:hypothetical protein